MKVEILKSLLEQFESDVMEWCAERRGPDRDYALHAKEEKNKTRAKILKAIDLLAASGDTR